MIYLDQYHAPFPSTNREIPLSYKSELVHAAQRAYTEGAFGNFLTQWIRYNGLEIHYDIFRMDTPYAFYAAPTRPAVVLLFALEGFLKMHLPGLDSQVLKAGRYQLVYVPEAHYELFPQVGLNRIFQLAFSFASFEMLRPAYPGADALLAHVGRKPGQGWHQQTLKITRRCRRIIDELCRCPDDHEMRKETFLKYWTERLFREYVHHLPVDPASWPTTQRERMQSVVDYLSQYPDLSLSIPALARQFGLSETSLRTQFVGYTGHTLRDFTYEVRMKKAMELLTEGQMPIRDIAYQLGYESQSSFGRAFHKKYGRSPRTFRAS
jgi:AraC-like DNA-binding protein